MDPELDLVLERVVDVPPGLVWAGWTQPHHLKKWFCPRPWRVTHCEIDLRPGGIFRTVMQGPDGTENDNTGCYLEVVPGSRIVWTGALEGDYRPSRAVEGAPFVFTAQVTIEPHGAGTRYRAVVMHALRSAAQTHQEMGFEAGWGAAFDQLVDEIRQGSIT
ncbi:MAG: SRPBCC family protein [Myxococcota bacterium]